MALEITSSNFDKEVLDSDKPVLVDFWAAWCNPCKMVGPVIEEISQEATDFKVVKVNIDENPDIASRYNIMSIPTIGLFKDGQLVKQSIGVQPKEQILSLLD